MPNRLLGVFPSFLNLGFTREPLMAPSPPPVELSYVSAVMCERVSGYIPWVMVTSNFTSDFTQKRNAFH
jgi:hypothetical protein